jgi:hypothetical protein
MRRPDRTDLSEALAAFDTAAANAAAAPLEGAARYEQRVAANLRDILRREQDLAARNEAAAIDRLQRLLGVAGDLSALEGELCRRIAEGIFTESDPELLEHLRLQARAQLEIDNPKYWSLHT